MHFRCPWKKVAPGRRMHSRCPWKNVAPNARMHSRRPWKKAAWPGDSLKRTLQGYALEGAAGKVRVK